MGLFQYVLIFLLPFSFGYPNKNLKQLTEWRLVPSEISFAPTNKTVFEFGCAPNEHFSICTAHCQHNCSTWGHPIACPEGCSSGCVCDDGYVRGPINECVLVEECHQSENNELEVKHFIDKEEKEEENEDFCPPNEIFSPCLAHCQKNCTNWSDLTVPCLKICVPGCICDNGLVRGPHGNCIPPRKCPISQDLQSLPGDMPVDCPVNEHFERCKAHCQKNCTNWNQDLKCRRICVPGCVCDKDLVRGLYGKCVTAEKCSFINQKPKTYIKKKKLNSCPDGEQRCNLQSLDDTNVNCTTGNEVIVHCPPTLLNGCVCKKGHVRGEDDRCIDRRLIPNANEIHFMRDYISNPVHSKSVSSPGITEEPSDFSESTEKTIREATTSQSVIPGVEINLKSIDTIEEISTTVDQEVSTDDDTIDFDDESHGCPDHQKCKKWCQEHGSAKGVCWESRRVCFCFEH